MPDSLSAQRVKDVAAARTIITDLRDRDSEAGKFRALVRNQIEGALPHSPTTLRKLGRADEDNTNYGAARADKEKACSGYFRLLWGPAQKIAVTIHRDTPDIERYEGAFQTCYARFLRRWGASAVIQHQSVIDDHVVFGIGTVAWEDRASPRWKCISRGSVRVRRGTKLDLAGLPLVNLTTSYSLADLYEAISDEGAAQSAGWNVPLVKRWIARLFNERAVGSPTRVPTDYEAIQDEIRDNCASASSVSDNLECETLLVVERDRTITRLVFTAEPPERQPGEGEVEDGFLFREPNFAESIERAIQMVVFEVPLGERTVHGVKGEGIKGYPHHRWDNRMRTKLTNAVNRSLSVNFIQGGNALTEYPVRQYGDVNVYNQGLTHVPLQQPIESGLALLGVWEQNRAANLQQYRQASSQIAQSETARQATILAGMEGEARMDQGTLFLVQFSEIKTEEMRRLRIKNSSDPDAKAFQRQMREYGVPDDIIFDAEITVDCAGTPGAMTPWQQDANNQKWLSLAGDPMVNKRYILEKVATDDFGPTGARRAILQTDDPQRAAQARQANIENGQFGTGMTADQIPALPQDEHSVHAAKHMEPLAAMAQEFQQTGRTTALKAQAAEQLAIHTNDHLELLRQNRNQMPTYQALQGPFKEMAALVPSMVKAAAATPEMAAQ